MRPLEVYDLTPREFDNYLQGRLNVIRHDNRMEWERTRWLAFIVTRVAGGKASSPKDLMLLEHEQPSKDEQKARIEMVNKKFPKTLNG